MTLIQARKPMKWDLKAVEELVRTKAKESNSLEFKRADSLYNSMNKAGTKSDDISKDVSAMANSNGGTIIYGIQEYNSGPNKSKAECIDWVDSEIISEEWIEQVINSRISPRIDNVRIIKIESNNKNCVFVLEIPKGDTAHQAQDKKYYKRYNFQAIPMDDWEIKDIINRKSKPKIEITLKAYPQYFGIEHVGKVDYDIQVLIHNKGMVGANYINCFVEIDLDAGKYIRMPHLLTFSDHIQINLTNKEEQELRLPNQTITLPSFYDPLLPLVYKTIGEIHILKGFLENKFNIKCKVATESTFDEFSFKSNEIEKKE